MYCIANRIHLCHVLQGKDMINFKKLLREAVGQSLASKVLSTLPAGWIQACCLTNKELMDFICTQWNYTFT